MIFVAYFCDVQRWFHFSAVAWVFFLLVCCRSITMGGWLHLLNASLGNANVLSLCRRLKGQIVRALFCFFPHQEMHLPGRLSEYGRCHNGSSLTLTLSFPLGNAVSPRPPSRCPGSFDWFKIMLSCVVSYLKSTSALCAACSFRLSYSEMHQTRKYRRKRGSVQGKGCAREANKDRL